MTIQTHSNLESILVYENDQVLYRFMGKFDVSLEEARGIFTSTKQWLWLNQQPSVPPLAITEPIAIIDEMWHNFILFTCEYTEFCRHFFGAYIHHAPVSHRDKERMAEERALDPDYFVQHRAQQMREQCALVYDLLGEDTLLRWYVEYPSRYGTAFFTHRRIVRPVDWQPTEGLRRMYENSRSQAPLSH